MSRSSTPSLYRPGSTTTTDGDRAQDVRLANAIVHIGEESNDAMILMGALVFYLDPGYPLVDIAALLHLAPRSATSAERIEALRTAAARLLAARDRIVTAQPSLASWLDALLTSTPGAGSDAVSGAQVGDFDIRDPGQEAWRAAFDALANASKAETGQA